MRETFFVNREPNAVTAAPFGWRFTPNGSRVLAFAVAAPFPRGGWHRSV